MTARIRIIYLILILTFIYTVSDGQDLYENSQIGIKIEKPRNWILATDELLESNLKKFEFNDEQLIKILNSNKGVLTLCTYYKYKTGTVSGLIPTVKITVRNNPTTTFSDFKQMLIASTERVKTVVQNFEFIDSYKDVKISSYPSLFYSCRYSFGLVSGEIMKVRNRYFMIPKGKYFISINFIDNETNEDNTEIYNHLIQSLQLIK